MQTDGSLYENFEENPKFPGGEEACMKFLADNLRYPKEAQEKGIQGRVYVQFVIDSLGYVTDPKIVRGVHPLLDQEALRLIRSLPRWTPGKIRGKPVATKFSISVFFPPKRP